MQAYNGWGILLGKSEVIVSAFTFFAADIGMTKTFCNRLKMVVTIFSAIMSLAFYLVKLESLIFYNRSINKRIVHDWGFCHSMNEIAVFPDS